MMRSWLVSVGPKNWQSDRSDWVPSLHSHYFRPISKSSTHYCRLSLWLKLAVIAPLHYFGWYTAHRPILLVVVLGVVYGAVPRSDSEKFGLEIRYKWASRTSRHPFSRKSTGHGCRGAFSSNMIELRTEILLIQAPSVTAGIAKRRLRSQARWQVNGANFWMVIAYTTQQGPRISNRYPESNCVYLPEISYDLTEWSRA